MRFIIQININFTVIGIGQGKVNINILSIDIVDRCVTKNDFISCIITECTGSGNKYISSVKRCYGAEFKIIFNIIPKVDIIIIVSVFEINIQAGIRINRDQTCVSLLLTYDNKPRI